MECFWEVLEVIARTGEGGGGWVEACVVEVGPALLPGGAGSCQSKGMGGAHVPLMASNARQAAGEPDQRNEG